ncbi:MAG: hypothetical protein Q9220_001106 [cf. Caloplaca sp. 1 TL-2023]
MADQVLCVACIRWFVNWPAYKSHMIDTRRQHYENNGDHKCTYCVDCEEDFTDAEGLRVHKRSTHNYCAQCDASFGSKEQRIQHWSNDQRHKFTYCTDCQDDFDTPDGLKNHWKTSKAHRGTYDYICDIKFATKVERTQHLNKDPDKHYVCSQHQLFLGSQTVLKDHYLTADGHPKCLACSVGFKDEMERQRHYWSVGRHVKCMKCKQGFEDEKQRDEHYWASSVHAKCLQCKEGFDDQASLQKHYWVSKEHGPTCDLCGIGFSSAAELRSHWTNSPCATLNIEQQEPSRPAQLIQHRSEDEDAEANTARTRSRQQKVMRTTGENARKRMAEIAEEVAKAEAEKRERIRIKIQNLDLAPTREKGNRSFQEDCSSVDPCQLVSESAEQLKEHHDQSKKHNYCQQSSVTFGCRDQPLSHWETSGDRNETYCARCNLHVDDWKSLWSDKVAAVGKHRICLHFHENRDTHNKLQYHFRISAAHTTMDHKSCSKDLASEGGLIEHLPVQNPKPLLCYSGCDESKSFKTLHSVIQHLESGTCSKGWTAQHINFIASENAIISKYLDTSTLQFFMAGPPRVHAMDEDYLSFAWRCYLCNAPCLSRKDLKRHLKGGLCHTPYPNVLGCLDCATKFTKLSALLHHIKDEGKSGPGDLETMAEGIKQEVGKNGGWAQPLKWVHELVVNNSRTKELCVNVRSPPESETNDST